MIAALRAMLCDDRGATLAEYGLVAAGIAVPFIIAALSILSTASVTLGSATGGMQSIGANPP
ncbi:MAG: Flp family type IVb pilin [bacterium]|nr:Flp family type IVb pilin [bacterium]